MFKPRTLTAKLLWIYVPLVCAGAIAVFAALELARFNSRIKILKTELQEVTDLQSVSVAKPLWEFDEQAIKEILHNLSRQPHFLEAVVVAADGAKIAEQRAEFATNFKGRVLSETREIIYNPKQTKGPLGTITIKFHTRQVEAEIQERLTLNSIVLGSLILMIIVITLVVTRRVIGKPLGDLKSSIEKLRDEKVREPVQWQTNDEIGQLVGAFNDLQVSQSEAEAEIRRYQDHLENLVAERTAELHASEARFRSVLDNSPAAIHLKDLDGKFEMVNPLFLDRRNLRQEDVIGKTSSEIMTATVAQTMISEDQKVLKSRRTRQFEVEETLKGDVPQVFMLNKFPILDPDGAAIGIGTINTDVTEFKRAENELAHTHALLTESLNYASQIQRGVLPEEDEFDRVFPDHFVIWEPREIVGGDIYWLRRFSESYLLCAADCTGHGVPGAFMTMIATGGLNQALVTEPPNNPAEILRIMNQYVKLVLGQDKSGGVADDGLEIGLCYVDTVTRELTYAGAGWSLLSHWDGGWQEIKGERHGTGYRNSPMTQTYTNHKIDLAKGQPFYLFSDGVPDQVGGAKKRGFGKRRMKETLLENINQPLPEQARRFMQVFRDYQGDEVRRDDVTVIGFRPV